MIKVGIIGGTGLDDPQLLKDYKEKDITTKYGNPSSRLTHGKLNGVDIVLIARHGKNHTIMPTNVPYQANIEALRLEGCTHILATSACGSLKKNIKPGDFIFIDQFIDRTTKRMQTFYEKDHVCHIPMAEPFCSYLRSILSRSATKLDLDYHDKGTIVTIEGPRFSTKAESNLFRQWNADVINMTTVPEVVLSREAGICYAAIAMATDYDCWMEGKEVEIKEILMVLKQNSANVKRLLIEALPNIKNNKECRCRHDIKGAIIS